MNWMQKIAGLTKLAADEQQVLSGPLVDSIIATVLDMFNRGAPVEKNDYGYNGTDYMDPTLRQVMGFAPGSEVPVPLLVHAVQSLWKYNNTQLGGQVTQLRSQLEAEMFRAGQTPLTPADQPPVTSPLDEPAVAPQPMDTRVRVLEWGSGYEQGKLKLFVPGLDTRVSARALNKMIRENAAALGYKEEEREIDLPGGGISTKWDFPLHKIRKKFKEAFDTLFLHKDFIPHFRDMLAGMNQKEEEIAAKKAKRKKEYTPFIWDLSELDNFASGTGENIEEPKPVVAIRKKESNYGKEYFISFTYDRAVIDAFKEFVHDTLGWWWPKGNKVDKGFEWHLRGTKDENFPMLIAFFQDHGYDTSQMKQIMLQLAEEEIATGEKGPLEGTTEQLRLVPMAAINATATTPYMVGLSLPVRVPREISSQFYEAVKLSFPVYKNAEGPGQRLLDKDNWIYYVSGSYRDFADFGNVAKNFGFDVSQLRVVFGELLDTGVLQKERLNGELDGYENPEQLHTAAAQVLQPGFELYDAQKEGVEHLYGRDSAFLGDETGAGKTIQAIVAAELRMRQTGGRALVVTKPAVKVQWMREISKFTGDTDISDNPEDDTRWTVITYAMFSHRKNGPILVEAIKQANYSTFIMDEVHNVKNKSKRTERIHDVGESIPFKWGLSATISANYPIDAWRQLKAVGHRLGDLSESAFRKDFAGQKYVRNQWGGKYEAPSEEAEFAAATKLNLWLTEHSGIYIRRTKKEINPNVSNHIVTENPVELSKTQKVKFNSAVAKRLSQYSDPDMAISEMIANRAEIATAKVPYSLDLADNVIAQDKKVLIFTCFRETAAKLAEGAQRILSNYGGGNVVTILGGDKGRDAKLDAFRGDPNTKIMILSILAGGTGIDLPNIVDDVIMNDYSWTPMEAEQAEGRAFRVTSENDVSTRYVLASDTVDEDFFSLVQKKRKLAAIIDHGTSAAEKIEAARELKRINQEMFEVARKRQQERKQASSWLGRVA